MKCIMLTDCISILKQAIGIGHILLIKSVVRVSVRVSVRVKMVAFCKSTGTGCGIVHGGAIHGKRKPQKIPQRRLLIGKKFWLNIMAAQSNQHQKYYQRIMKVERLLEAYPQVWNYRGQQTDFAVRHENDRTRKSV